MATFGLSPEEFRRQYEQARREREAQDRKQAEQAKKSK